MAVGETSHGLFIMNIKRQMEAFMTERTENVEQPLWLPTGSTMLNLACSANAHTGYVPGSIVNLVGDSATGKTALCLTMLAEMAWDEKYSNHHLVYDDVETAMCFDVGALFGDRLEERLEKPAANSDDPDRMTDTIQAFLFNLMDWAELGEPFVYVLDSFDALTSEEELDEVLTEKTAYDKGKTTSGTYGTAKAKAASRMFRVVARKVKQLDSLIVVVSQTRDNIGFGFEKKTRAGGKALKFYSTHEIWLENKGVIKSRDLQIGDKVLAKVKKNKSNGRRREVGFEIYYDYGIDDIGSMVDFLVEQGHWAKSKQTVDAVEFEMAGTRAKLISTIEEQDGEDTLRALVEKVWLEREEAIKMGRKGRFHAPE